MGAVRVAVIDSGVHAAHPHVNGVAGGVGIRSGEPEDPDFTDRLGHGTAVTAVIREKAPDAEIYAVKVFHETLATRAEVLVRAIDWAAGRRVHIINLSLGTSNPEHEEVLQAAVNRAANASILLVAAYEDGIRWFPGSLPGAVPVGLDWDCPRDQFRTGALPDGRTLYRASGYPRPIPGVSVERNLKGLSFAVANVSGLLARTFQVAGGSATLGG